jgi:hypothetical protein
MTTTQRQSLHTTGLAESGKLTRRGADWMALSESLFFKGSEPGAQLVWSNPDNGSNHLGFDWTLPFPFS